MATEIWQASVPAHVSQEVLNGAAGAVLTMSHTRLDGHCAPAGPACMRATNPHCNMTWPALMRAVCAPYTV